MACKRIIHLLDEYLEKTLDREEMSMITRHLGQCSSCQQEYSEMQALQKALHHLSVVPPSEGAFDRILENAAHHAESHRRRPWGMIGGGAMAASIVFALTIGFLIPGKQELTSPMQKESPVLASLNNGSANDISIRLGEVRTVSLAINSAVALQDVVFTIDLPSGIELNGFPKQHTLSWRGQLNKGENLLELPIVARLDTGGVIKARIEHGGKQSEFRLNMEVGRDVEQPDLRKMVRGV